MKQGRNPRLIRNLIGNRTNEHVVRFVETVHELGTSSFPSRVTQLFKWAHAESNLRFIADTSVWVVRVMPDDAKVWMDTLMAEYDLVKDRNPIYVHLMFIVLMETSAALAALPYDCTSDGKDFEKNIHDWLAKLLLDGKTVVLFANHQDAIAKAVKAFTKHHLAKFRICDTMQAIISADDKYRWVPSSVSEYVIREIAEKMVVRFYDHNEVIFALSKYRDGRRT